MVLVRGDHSAAATPEAFPYPQHAYSHELGKQGGGRRFLVLIIT